jgi:hypothetical protein
MSKSVFDNKLIVPNDEILKNELGSGRLFFDRITGHIESVYGKITPEWKFYGKSSGWILKLQTDRKNVMFVIPQKGSLIVAITLGEKAIIAALDSGLPNRIKEDFKAAKKYVEGRTIQIVVDTNEKCDSILSIIEFKMLI